MQAINAQPIRFVWAQCKLVLRRVYREFSSGQITGESYENLQGQVQVQDDEIQQPFIPTIRFKKRLPYKNLTFKWSIKRNLPNLKINLQKKYFDKIKQQQQIVDLFTQVTGAYAAKRQNHYYLQEVRLNGSKTKKFNQFGNVIFSDLKFSSSSAKINMKNFCLIVSICARCLQQQKLIIKSFICSQIFVHSSIQRKITNSPKQPFKISQQQIKAQPPTQYQEPN